MLQDSLAYVQTLLNIVQHSFNFSILTILFVTQNK